MSQVERKPTPPLHEEIEDKASINDISKGVAIANKQGLSAELAVAIAGTNIDPWSRNSFKLYMAIFCSVCCAYANGYDGSLMTALNAMKPFQKQFNIGTTGPLVSVMFSLYSVGNFIGSTFAAVITDKFGRRKAMASGACVIIVGSIIGATAKHIAQFMVARFILGFGISIMSVSSPAYSMEIALPQWRGRCTGIYNCGWYAGAIPSAAVTFGTNYLASNLSWQIPVVLQCLACTVVLCLFPFIPESPRYLMAQGRVEEVHAFLTKYHGGGDANAPLVLLELEEMQASISTDGMDKRWWDYSGLLATRPARWRTLQVAMMAVFGHWSGNGLAYFATTIYKNIGVTTVTAQLGYNLLYSSMSAVGALTGALLTDHMPRRYVLSIGSLVLSVILGVFTGLNAIITGDLKAGRAIDPSLGRGAIAVYVLFGISCAFVYTPLQAVVTVEALSTPMRAKGIALSNIITQAIGFINLFAGPIALASIGYRYIFVFVFWDAFEAVCWWFFGVEARGRSLEELDWIYEQPNPVKASKSI